MAELVYVLCAITSLACALMLGRAYSRSKQRLLMWSTLCFVGLFLNNVATFIDLIVLPTEFDLHWVRGAVGFISAGLLSVGLVWEAK